MKLVKLSAILGLVLLFSGCTSIHLKSPESDEYKRTVSFTAGPDKANVYVYRQEDDLAGFALEIDVDDQTVTTTRNSFFLVELEPGTHELVAHIPDILGSNGEVMQEFEAGREYFFEMEAETRFFLPDVMHLTAQEKQAATSVIIDNKLRLLDLEKMRD